MLGDELLQGDVIVEGDVGEAGLAVGGGMLEGEVDKPFPSMFGTTKKYSSGSRAMPLRSTTRSPGAARNTTLGRQ
jgi:hypothetical protein